MSLNVQIQRIDMHSRTIYILLTAMVILPCILCMVLISRDCRQSPKTEDVNDVCTDAAADNNGNSDRILCNRFLISPGLFLKLRNEKTAEVELVKDALYNGRRVVYLTFDDGPGANTEKLLDILDKYNVKATFFINGHEGYDEVLYRMAESGHSIGLHTYSHDYDLVYSDIELFKEDMEILEKYLYNATGTESELFRFPGGSATKQASDKIKKQIVRYLDTKNMVYFDWNVSSGDGIGGLTAQDVYNNVIDGIHSHDISIVLMHDAVSRPGTLEALPWIIKELQLEDTLILPITADTRPVRYMEITSTGE